MSDTDEGQRALEAAAQTHANLHQPSAQYRPAPVLMEDMRAAKFIVRAFLTALPSWRLVPAEATEEMVKAAQKLDMGTIAMPGGEHLPHRLSDSDAWEAWLCMINTAPLPPGLEPDRD